MKQLKIAEEKGLKDVKAFQLNDFDTVAAYTLDEAKSWYLETTGIDEEDAFEDVCERSLNTKIWEDESMKNKITLQEAINRYWKGEPFVVASTES